MPQGLTTALAALGAATGVSSATVQIVAAVRDRSRLRLRADVQTLVGKPPRIAIDVVNDSPRATTVREVGLYAHPVRIKVGREGEGSREGVAEIDFAFSE